MYDLGIYIVYSCIKVTLIDVEIVIGKNWYSEFLTGLEFSKRCRWYSSKCNKGVFGRADKIASLKFTSSKNKLSAVCCEGFRTLFS